MTDVAKKKIKFELQTFISICVFVFGLGMARMNLQNTQKTILTKLNEVSQTQTKFLEKSETEHTDIKETFAWVTPTLHTVAKKL